MKSIERVDQQPTAVDQPLLRIRNVFQDRRSGKDRRVGYTCMDPAMDRRICQRRKNTRRSRDRRVAVSHTDIDTERRNGERRKKSRWLRRQ
jgi:hypothetical protein